MKDSAEQAIKGKTAGLIGINETVTWRARHFGIRMKMTIKITDLHYPHSFTDRMAKGPFKMLCHTHYFTAQVDGTVMTDEFEFRSPLGYLGKIADLLFLKHYMKRLLEKRNYCLKQAALAVPAWSQQNHIST
ncbi:MAG: hypothetical protein EOP45_22725 [Sphingobacteriaceae bacterium]|nr:MAG: hypothetical protein EOP45_22725 [Sphingobacteriaceae bacterium]